MEAEDAQMEVRTGGRRRTRAPLAECNRNMAQDRSRSPIKFSGKADNANELPKTPNKDPCSDDTTEDFNTSPISSYMSTDCTETSDTEHEADSFCLKIKARFTDSGEPMDYSVPRPSDPIVLGSSFLQKNPEFTFAESAQFTASTPKLANTPAAKLYYAESDVVTIAPVYESCELDSGLGTSIESPQSQLPSEGGVLQRALEGIFDDEQGNQSYDEGSEEEEEENEESVADKDNNAIDVIGQPEIINDQNEQAQAPVEVPDLDILLPEREAPAPLLDNIQWYHKRREMKVREALADAGVCATEVLMDELRFRPGIYHQRLETWHSKNRMTAGGIREVLLRLGADDSSTAAYRKIFDNLQNFSGTYIFLRHSLDHGDFPPELQYLQEEALKVRKTSPGYNPERAQCLRINKDFNDVLFQRAVRAARQFGALAQKVAESNRVNGDANAEQAAHQEDEEILS